MDKTADRFESFHLNELKLVKWACFALQPEIQSFDINLLILRIRSLLDETIYLSSSLYLHDADVINWQFFTCGINQLPSQLWATIASTFIIFCMFTDNEFSLKNLYFLWLISFILKWIKWCNGRHIHIQSVHGR